tara:strand:+ start:227 stop:496 length:270 start_codon:yes stop_codon:yes gene_type:complete
MDKLDMDKPYLITQAQRMDLLNSHNKLRDILQTITECNDIWVSQVQHLETLECELHRILKFVPKRGEDGNIIWGADWILFEHSKDDDDS